ncbi:MAG: class I SAM-dependent methyltransferase [Pseudomonadota bacterium]
MNKIARLSNLITYSITAIRRRGIAFLWTYFIESIWFDWKNKTNTSVRVPKSDQVVEGSGSEQDDGLLYVASFTSVVKNSVQAAKTYIGSSTFERTQFVDLGCGKGKTLLQFALHERAGNSHPAIGIEYDGALADIARQNVRKCKLEDSVVIHTASALDVCDFLASGTVLFYLYNSFQGETLRQFLSAVEHLPHCLIYVDPVEKRTVVDDFGYVPVKDVVGKYHANTWMLLASKQMAGTASDDRIN